MTDEFEELIRSAGRGLGTEGETPTYHGAWQRGQRRRVLKRASMTAAGACALVLAFSVSVGQFGEDRSVEVSEVATNAVEAAPITPSPSVAPALRGSPDDEVASSPDLSPAPVPAPAEPEASGQELSDTDADSTDETRPEPTARIVIPIPLDPPSSVDVVEPLPEPSPSPTAPAETATSEPTPVPTPEPTLTVLPGFDDAITTGPATSFEGSDAVDDDGSGAGTDVLDPPDDGGPQGAEDPAGGTRGGETGATGGDTGEPEPQGDPTSTPEPSPTSPETLPANGGGNDRVDAVILRSFTRIDPGIFGCDTDFDGVADATCEVLASYLCSDESEATEGYEALDTSGDGVVDTCVPAVATSCRIAVNGARELVDCLIRVRRG